MTSKSLEKYALAPKQVENYVESQNSQEKYEVHHRLETPDYRNAEQEQMVGIQHDEYISKEALRKMGLYYSRPADELILLTREQHKKTHGKDPNMRKKMSCSRSGMKNHRYGKEVLQTTRDKISKSNVGKRWYNNGEVEIQSKVIPAGFKPGRLPRLRSFSQESTHL